MQEVFTTWDIMLQHKVQYKSFWLKVNLVNNVVHYISKSHLSSKSSVSLGNGGVAVRLAWCTGSRAVGSEVGHHQFVPSIKLLEMSPCWEPKLEVFLNEVTTGGLEMKMVLNRTLDIWEKDHGATSLMQTNEEGWTKQGKIWMLRKLVMKIWALLKTMQTGFHPLQLKLKAQFLQDLCALHNQYSFELFDQKVCRDIWTNKGLEEDCQNLYGTGGFEKWP